MRSLFSVIFIIGITTVLSCNNGKDAGGNKPIVLGDPATIVTETDTQYLQDFVADFKLIKQKPEEVVTVQNNEHLADSVATKIATPINNIALDNGLKVPFKEVTIFIPGIETRTYYEQDMENAPGASYEITDGRLQGNELRIISGEVDKVYQRYQTVVIAENSLGVLVLESLNELEEWKPVNGSNNVYLIKGLTKKDLAYKRASKAAIRNAVNKATRRMSRTMRNRWAHSLRNVSSVTQKPLRVVLRSVMWKIEGRDPDGRRFQKQLRIDIPIQ